MTTLLEDLSSQVKKVENVLRGHTKFSDEELLNWTKSCYELYMRASADETLKDYESCLASEKTPYLEIAVKLFNKVRNVTSPNLNEIKTVLKGSCAWIFSIFSDRNSKVLSVIIKSLNKCANDFTILYAKDDLAHICCSSVIRLWEVGSECNAFNELPPLEVLLLRECVFHSVLLMIDRLAVNDIGSKPLKQTISFALELSQGLSIKSKLTLINRLVRIGKAANKESPVDVTLSIFQAALRLLNSPTMMQSELSNDLKSTMTSESIRQVNQSIVDSKLSCLLCMAFVYSENRVSTRDFQAAADCITNIEALQTQSNSKLYNQTLLFAKIMIAVAQDDAHAAYSLLTTLLQFQSTDGHFDALLCAAKSVADIVLKGGSSASGYSDIYKLLSLRFPNDPYFTRIRISHLQTSIAAEKLDEGAAHEKAYEIAGRIVSDHINGLRKLDEDCQSNLCKIFAHEMSWLKDKSLWRKLNAWCDIFIQFVDSSHLYKDLSQCAHLQKVQVLIKLHEYSTALSIAHKALEEHFDRRTVVLFFQCLLHYEDIPKSSLVLYFLERIEAAMANHSANRIPVAIEDQMGQLLDCCACTESAENLSSEQKNEILEDLVLAWVKLFSAGRGWQAMEATTTNDQESLGTQHSFFEMVNAYLYYVYQRSLRNIISIEPGKAVPIIANEIDFDVAKRIATKLQDLILLVKGVIESVAMECLDQNILGLSSDLHWFGEFVCAMGSAFIKRASAMAVSAEASMPVEDLEAIIEILKHGAFYYESGAHFYGCVPISPSYEYTATMRLRIKCLMMAAGAHMDALQFWSRLQQRVNAQCDQIDKVAINLEQEKLVRMSMARKCCEYVEDIIKKLGDCVDDEDVALTGANAVLLFSTYCSCGSSQACEAFIHSKRSDLVMLPVSSLEQFIELASLSKVCTMDTLRLLVAEVLQACMSRPAIPFRFVGFLYRKSLELSPSRKIALDKVQEIEQFFKTIEHPQELLEQDDIDGIFALTYNYGVALMDLDQLALAEQFVRRTLSIAQYVSSSMQSWAPKLHEILATIQQSKSEAILPLSRLQDVESSTGQMAGVVSPTMGRSGHLALDTFKPST